MVNYAVADGFVGGLILTVHLGCCLVRLELEPDSTPIEIRNSPGKFWKINPLFKSQETLSFLRYSTTIEQNFTGCTETAVYPPRAKLLDDIFRICTTVGAPPMQTTPSWSIPPLSDGRLGFSLEVGGCDSFDRSGICRHDAINSCDFITGYSISYRE